MIRLVAILLALAATAKAETEIGPEGFETLVEGRTLQFDRGGAIYGIEQYLPGRKVIWQYADGSCDRGVWFGSGQDICFTYERAPLPQCWTFVNRNGSYYARLTGLPPGDASEIQMSRELPGPPACVDPNLGV